MPSQITLTFPPYVVQIFAVYRCSFVIPSREFKNLPSAVILNKSQSAYLTAAERDEIADTIANLQSEGKVIVYFAGFDKTTDQISFNGVSLTTILANLIQAANMQTDMTETFNGPVDTTPFEYIEADSTRNYLIIQNTGSDAIVIKPNTANASGTDGIVIPPGGTYEPSVGPTNAFYMRAATSSSDAIIWEGYLP